MLRLQSSRVILYKSYNINDILSDIKGYTVNETPIAQYSRTFCNIFIA